MVLQEDNKRFEFGENWARFLTSLNEERIVAAEESLKNVLAVRDLKGLTFLDIGSGSGLFSLAARRLGAKVTSFDLDQQSVACTENLKSSYYPNDKSWTIKRGSAADQGFVKTLGSFDIVYSWGVLHHTGNMEAAFETIIPLVKKQGKLLLAIYNDQGLPTRYWSLIKKLYVRSVLMRYLIVCLHTPYFFFGRLLFRALTKRLQIERGMAVWYDMVDWLGGYPFEVAKPEFVFHFFKQRGFELEYLQTCAGKMGCNEYLFSRRLEPL